MSDFDIHKRLGELQEQTEIGKRLLEELDLEQRKANTEFDEKRSSVARNLVAMNGAMTVLREMGAKAPEAAAPLEAALKLATAARAEPPVLVAPEAVAVP